MTAVLTAAGAATGHRRAGWPRAALPPAVAAVGAITAIALRWRGGDLPAHWFRVALVREDGFQIWNNQWFGGHHTLGYGALVPVLGAAIGLWTVAVLSSIASPPSPTLIRGVPEPNESSSERTDSLPAPACRCRCGSPSARSPTSRSGVCRSRSGSPSGSARSSRPNATARR